MALADLKFETSDFTNQDIASLPNKPSDAGMTAAQLKARFDNIGKLMLAQGNFNDLIDLLIGTGGAAGIGITAIDGITADTIQNAIVGLKDYIDGVVLSSGAVTSVNGEAGAVVLGYADVGASPEGAATKISGTGTLASASWVGASAPYTQSITLTGLTADDIPRWDVVASAIPATALAEWEFASKMSCASTTNTATFSYMDEDPPDIALNMNIEVVRE